MLRGVLLALLVVQLVDLYALVWLGRQVGLFQTLFLLLAMGALGGALARREGLRVWRGWTRALEMGCAPEEGVVSGMLLLLSSVLFVAPGFLTDGVALVLLIPAIRRALARYVGRRWRAQGAAGWSVQAFSRTAFDAPESSLGGERASGGDRGDVIETTGVEQRSEASSQRVPRALPERAP